MKYLVYILSVLFILLGTGCSDDNELSGEQPKKGIVLELNTGNFETKTHLYSQDNLHNVQKVYAILYYCGKTLGETATIDPTTTKVVASQLLRKGENGQGDVWNPSNDKELGNNMFELTLPEEQITLVPGKYMVLCVGLDDESGETYGLSYDAQTVVTGPTVTTGIPAFAQVGATLAQAQAALQGIYTPTDEPQHYEKDPAKDPNNPDAKPNDKDIISYGHPKMAHAELFAGWQSFDFMPDDLNVVRVELRRRVAGVLCYLSDIPYKLNNEGSPYRVTKVRLNLCTPQNTEVSLLRKQQTVDGTRNDFGTKPNVSPVICEFDLMQFKANDDNTLYQIPTAHLKGIREQLPNTILMGAYLLPMRIEETVTTPTFEIELLGYPYDDNIDGNITEEDLQKEIVSIKKFPALYEGQDKKTFPIHPNMIYHIGQKLETNNTEGDYPESLAGTKVTVKEENWENTEVEVEFPSVPVNPTMRIICKNGEYKVQPKSGVPDDSFYIFDCMGTGTDINYLEVTPSILFDRWKVKVVSTMDDHMLYFQSPEDNTKYVNEYTGEGTAVIPIVITDYAVRDGNDIRRVELKIVSLDADGKEQPYYTTLAVQQYNAIIVEVFDEDKVSKGFRGFSHFDFGTERDLSTGKIKRGGEKIKWGYFSSWPIYIYGHSLNRSSITDGLVNWENVQDAAADEYFDKSAIQVCGREGCTVTNNGDLLKAMPTWYLPSFYEMESFLNDSKATNIDPTTWYWSSYAVRANKYDTWGLKKNQEKELDRDEMYLARQACHVSN